MGRAGLNERSRCAQRTIAANPDIFLRVLAVLHTAIPFLDRFPEAESDILQRASEHKVGRQRPRFFWRSVTTIAVLRGDQDQMARAAGTRQRQAQGRTLDRPSGGPLALARSGRLQAARRSSNRAIDLALQQEEHARRQRLIRPHEPCGNRFPEMAPKEKRALWRHSNSPTPARSNTPPALPWLFRATLPDRKRSPGI